jgi:aldehyde:ferredoxin oxidoreductase
MSSLGEWWAASTRSDRGFFGEVLLVDLSRGTIETKEIAPAVYRQVMGGYGLGVRLLYDWMPPGADPLGPDNILGFVPGLLTGAGVLFGGRFMVVGKSPLTGGWGDSNCGGHFGSLLRATGVDGLFFTGVSDEPVYMVVDGEHGDRRHPWALRDARHLWGLETRETERRLKEEMGRRAHVMSIGPAGENRSLIAAIITDGGRAAARSGLAAVMGTKRLKAVVVRGQERLPIHDKEAVRQLNREYGQIFKTENRSPFSPLLFGMTKTLAPLIQWLRLKPSGPADAIIHLYRKYGTCGATAFTTEVGDAPVWNWRGVAVRDFPLSRSTKISDEAVIEHQVRSYHCRYCPVGCGGIVQLEDEARTGAEGDPEKGGASRREAHKPEYETLAAFGPLLLNDDLGSIFKVNDLCDRFGLDTISTGATVAFAIECAEHGLIDASLGDGLTLSWGSAEAIVELVRRIAHRDGIGDLLADGVRRASERISEEAEASAAFAMHAGGQELPMHDARYEPVLGLAYVVDPTPGRHNTANSGLIDIEALREILELEGLSLSGRYEYDKKGTEFALLNRYLQVVNCAGLCMFSLIMGRPPVRAWINAVTGWDLNLQELLRIGHRVQVLRHVFNLREGIRIGDISLPDRASGHPPLEKGPLRGISLDMEAMKQDYFRAMGYDADGVPTRDVLRSLGLTQVAAEASLQRAI